MLADRPESDRGQLLIITALALAIILVGLALVLNSAIYTENLSTRESTDSVEVTSVVGDGEEELEHTIRYVNHHNNSSTDQVNRAFDDAVSNIKNDTSEQQAQRGASYQFEVVDRTNGTHLRHTNSSRSFVSGGTSPDQANWVLTDNAPRLRFYQMTVQPRYLYNTTDSSFDTLMDTGFHVNMTGQDAGGNTVTWNIYLYEDDDTGDVVVVGGEETDLLNASSLSDLTTFNDKCRVSVASDAENVTVDIANGSVDGNACPGLEFQESFDSAISIRYENADNDTLGQPRSGGTYELTIGTTNYESQHFYDSSGAQSPYATHIIYDARIESEYSRSDITHSRTVRVHPGDEGYVA